MEPRQYQQPLHIPRAIVEWLLQEYEEQPGSTIKKSDLYEAYEEFCKEHKMRPKDPNTFGKMVLRVFPQVFTRRLGPLARQVAHYSGIAPKYASEDEDDPATTLTETVPAVSVLPTTSTNPTLNTNNRAPSSGINPAIGKIPSPIPPQPQQSLPTTTIASTFSGLPPVRIDAPKHHPQPQLLSFTPLEQQRIFGTFLAQDCNQPSHAPAAVADVATVRMSNPFLGMPPNDPQTQDMELELLVQQLINDGAGVEADSSIWG